MLYTIGYNNFSFYDFKEKIVSLNAIIIDVRYIPQSYNPFWNKQYLVQHFKSNYLHLKELGNLNYKNPKLDFDVLDLDLGSERVIDYMDLEFDCILLCACRDFNKCHRKLIAKFIQNKTKCEIVHL